MARNPIQFQPGLSLPAFLKQYGTEAQCQEALFQHRWPKGFVCPDCAMLPAAGYRGGITSAIAVTIRRH